MITTVGGGPLNLIREDQCNTSPILARKEKYNGLVLTFKFNWNLFFVIEGRRVSELKPFSENHKTSHGLLHTTK